MILNVNAILCDDVSMNAAGKMSVSGIYGDVAFAYEGVPAGQLIVLFIVSLEMNDLPEKLVFEVTMPRWPPVTAELALIPGVVPEGRSTMAVRYPFMVHSCPLYAGRLEARVIAGNQECSVPAGWLVHNPIKISPNSESTASPPPVAQSPTARKRKGKPL